MESENKSDSKPYKRHSLKRVSDSDKKVLNIKESKILENKFGENLIKEFSLVDLSHLYFYHYCCESVDDTNWGCAWRSMQTVLKYQLSLTNQNKDNEISFYNLFMKYGAKNTLIEIYKKMKKNENISEKIKILDKKHFSPHETESGWAEPFISQLVLYDFGFEGELLLINDYKSMFFAPKEVFDEIIDFSKFKELLKNHFRQKNPVPIILDDGCISVSVFGVKFDQDNNNIDLIFMDPHAINKPEIGIYIITLDENGEFININPFEHVLASEAIMFSNKKPWMVYFPKSN